MTSALVPVVGETYQYTNLKDATGSVNVIAVVKYHRAPIKTRGSGYSLFATLTDPSLNGAKLPCVFFNDALDKLPQVQGAGDVIIMHRLIVKEFRGDNQGCGYGTVGFSAAVFSGQNSDPLVPRPSKTNCRFGDEELRRVRELRDWFNSPNCPVERELTTDLTNLTQPRQANETIGVGCSKAPVKRLWHLRPGEFTSTEGQVVAIYRYPEGDPCCLLYLWDGAPPESSIPLPSFLGPSREHMVRLLQNALHEPTLCTITAHESAYASIDDWSVPVFIYDEHAATPVLQNMKPGDIIRIQNLHVAKCRPLECEKNGCLRLLVHGGGHRFGRGLQLLRQGSLGLVPSTSTEQATDESFVMANQYGLLSNLLEGIKCRPFHLQLRANQTAEALTISEVCSIPATYHRLDAESFNISPILFNANSESPSSPSSPAKWFRVTRDGADRRGRTAVLARLLARVIDIFPRTVNDLKNVTLLICTQCRSNIRVSCWEAGEVPCSCQMSKTGPRSDELFMLAPFVFLKLEDCTGQLLVCASLTSAMILLTQASSPSESETQWKELSNELLRSSSSGSSLSVSLKMLHQLSSLLHQSVDLVVEPNWRTEWDVGIPSPLDELQFRVDIPSGPQFSLVWRTRS